jgi:hypothetical protein
MAKKKSTPAEDQIKLLKESQATGKALGLEYDDIADIQEKILNKQIRSNEALLASLKLNKQNLEIHRTQIKLQDQRLKRDEENFKLAEKEKKQAADRTKEALKYNSITDDLNDSIKSMQKTLFSNTEDTYNAQKKIVKQRKQEIQEAKSLGTITDEDAEIQENKLRSFDDQIDAVQRLQSEYQKEFDALTSLGGFLTKTFGEVGGILSGSLNAGMEAFTEEMSKSGDSAEASKNAMEAFGGEITAGITNMLSLAGIATMLYTALTEAAKQVTDFANKTGASVAQSEKLVDRAKQYALTSEMSLANATEALVVQEQMIAAYGIVNTLSEETAANVAQLGSSFGYGAELAGQVQASMMGIGASAEDAMKIQGFTSALAEAAGVAPGAVMKDIAQNAKVTAKYFAGNPKALAKAAVEAARIGLSLQDMASVADKLLDIEGSLTAQFEASAMAGRSINMDKARQLALEGDIAGATKAALEQVGTLAEFENMSVLQKKKIAEAAGMEVGQIEKSLQLQEKMLGMSKEQQDLVTKYGDSLGDISNASADEILQRTSSLQAAEGLSDTMSKMKDTMSTALVPIAKVFAGIFQLISPILTGIMRPLNGIVKIFTWINELMAEWTSGMSFLTVIADGLGWVFDKIGAVLGVVLIPLMAAFAVNAAIAAGNMIASAIGMIFNTFAMIPFGLGIPLAIAGAAGLVGIAASYLMDDGVIEPGYGSRVLSTPEGSISLNNKDTVVAGTNLFGGESSSEGQSASSSSPASMGKVEALLSELISLTRQSLTQPVPVVIGDKAINEIGKGITTGASYKPAGNR